MVGFILFLLAVAMFVATDAIIVGYLLSAWLCYVGSFNSGIQDDRTVLNWDMQFFFFLLIDIYFFFVIILFKFNLLE